MGEIIAVASVEMIHRSCVHWPCFRRSRCVRASRCAKPFSHSRLQSTLRNNFVHSDPACADDLAYVLQLHSGSSSRVVMLARAARSAAARYSRQTGCEALELASRSRSSGAPSRLPLRLSRTIPHRKDDVRYASSSSSTRWKSRQGKDAFARDAKVAGLKSRAAFKLLEINEKFRLFRKGDTVVDLGFAPGSWSQVAVNRTSPGGRVVGIDIIPAQPPRGANALQGNFLSAEIREEVRKFVSDPNRGRVRRRNISDDQVTEEDLMEESRGVLELERRAVEEEEERKAEDIPKEQMTQRQLDMAEGRVVDVIISDMSEPWPLVTSTWVKSVSNPWVRLQNTSGIVARDHGGSMDLCNAALRFTYDTLATGGHFLTKFYTGSEDHALEMRLKKLFEKVQRIKPDSSRKESREAYLLGMRRKAGVKRKDVLEEG